jgi:hypothetical protein
VKTSILSGGVFCVLGTAVISALLPQFLRYDGREGVKRKEMEEALRVTESKLFVVE